MSSLKTTDLLFKCKLANKKIELADINVNTSGPKGVQCLSRPTTARNAAAKYSTVGMILDLLILKKSILGMQSTNSVYAKFEHENNVYEGLYDGDQITWVSPEPNGYLCLVPVVLYTLSDLFTGDGAEELKGYFKDIKENKDKNAVLLFCDTFYYSYAKLAEKDTIFSYASAIPKETIRNGIASGALKPISLLSGLCNDIADVDEPEPEQIVENFAVSYDAWDESQKERIPSPNILKNFIKTDTTTALAKKIKFRTDRIMERLNAGLKGREAIGSDYVNVLLVGRPSSGKSATLEAVAAMVGMPFYSIPFSKHTEEDVVEGKNKVLDGKIGFVETDFLKAYEHGGIIVCEEINLADPGVVMGCMGQAIEAPFLVMKDGYKPIHRHPMCIIFATMNTGTAGSRELNEALSSRFKNTYILEDPEKLTFISILESKGHERRRCRGIYDAYIRIMNWLKAPEQSREDLCDNLTLRGCLGALESMEEGQSSEDALRNSLVGKIAEKDLEMAQKVMKDVISNLANIN